MYHSFYSELRCLSSHGLRIYVILDASRAATLYPLIQAHQDDAYCLFKGELPQTMKAVAPYLIELRHYNHWHQQLLRYVLEHRYGILFVSAWDQSRLERHFRHFSRVKQAKALQQQNPSASPFMFFRYYDPHYLPPLLLHLDSRSQRLFFAPFYALFGANFQGFYQLYLDEQGQLEQRTSSTPSIYNWHYILANTSPLRNISYKTLVIDLPHIKAIKTRVAQKFIVEMMEHSKNLAPDLCQTLTFQQLYYAVDQSINKALSYGFSQRGPIRLFMDLSVLFGCDFDQDPQYDWAHAPLKTLKDNPNSQAPMTISLQLYHRMQDYLTTIQAFDPITHLLVLKQLHQVSRNPPPIALDHSPSTLLKLVHSIYPEKAQYLGHTRITTLIKYLAPLNQRYGPSTPSVYCLLLGLTMGFGCGFYHDPFYPWIQNTLTDTRITDETARMMRLEKKVRTWLNALIKKTTIHTELSH